MTNPTAAPDTAGQDTFDSSTPPLSTTTVLYPPRLPRGRRSALTIVVIVALLGSAVLAATAALQIHAGGHMTVLGDIGTVARTLRDTRWHDPAVLAGGIGTAVLGLLLLTAAFTPARCTLIELTEPDPRTAVGLTRRGLRRDLHATACAIDGIIAARVRLRRGRVRVIAVSPLRDMTGLPQALHGALQARLTDLAPVRPFTVRVRVTARER